MPSTPHSGVGPRFGRRAASEPPPRQRQHSTVAPRTRRRTPVGCAAETWPEARSMWAPASTVAGSGFATMLSQQGHAPHRRRPYSGTRKRVASASQLLCEPPTLGVTRGHRFPASAEKIAVAEASAGLGSALCWRPSPREIDVTRKNSGPQVGLGGAGASTRHRRVDASPRCSLVAFGSGQLRGAAGGPQGGRVRAARKAAEDSSHQTTAEPPRRRPVAVM
jgi:hypothetical protein